MNNLIKQPDRRSSERTEISWDDYYKTRRLTDIYPDITSAADELEEGLDDLLAFTKLMTAAFVILLAICGFAIWAYP